MAHSERKAAKPKEFLCGRCAAQLAGNLAHRGLLMGYAEIARYCGVSIWKIHRFRKSSGFPVIRWGMFCVSSPTLIDSWLLAYERARRSMPAKDPPPDLT